MWWAWWAWRAWRAWGGRGAIFTAAVTAARGGGMNRPWRRARGRGKKSLATQAAEKAAKAAEKAKLAAFLLNKYVRAGGRRQQIDRLATAARRQRARTNERARRGRVRGGEDVRGAGRGAAPLFYVAGLLPLFVCLSLITHRRTDH